MLDLLKRIGSAVGLTQVPPGAKPPVFQVPAILPALSAKNGAELAKAGGFASGVPGPADPAAQSSSQFLATALNERQEVAPATRAIARTLPEQKRLEWAVASCERVEDHMAPADRDAFAAARAYLTKPGPAEGRLAGEAAAKSGYRGPGAFAAKAVSLSSEARTGTATAEAPAAAPPTGTDPVGDCVAGAVSLAALLECGKLPSAESLAAGERQAAAAAAAAATPATSAGASACAAVAAALPPTAEEITEVSHAMKPYIEDGLVRAAG